MSDFETVDTVFQMLGALNILLLCMEICVLCIFSLSCSLVVRSVFLIDEF